MSKYDDIRSALEVALATIPGLPAIAWENRPYNPTTGTPYIQVRQVPTSRVPAVRGLNPQMRYQGIFRLFVKMPELQGPGPGEDIVESLLNTFEATTDLSFTNSNNETIHVTIDYAEQVGAYNESPWYTLPVNIGWYSYSL